MILQHGIAVDLQSAAGIRLIIKREFRIGFVRRVALSLYIRAGPRRVAPRRAAPRRYARMERTLARARHRPCEGKSISRANWFDCVCLLVRVRNVFRVVAQALPRIHVYTHSYTREYRAATHTTCRCNEAFVRLMHRRSLSYRALQYAHTSRRTYTMYVPATAIVARCTNARTHVRVPTVCRI